MRARDADRADAARERDELGPPVAHREHGIDPLEARDGRAPRRGRASFRERREPRPDAGDQPVARVAGAEDARDVSEPVEDAVNRSRVQRHHLAPHQLRRRSVREIGRADRADVAVGLRDDDVRRERRQERLVDLVQRRSRAQPLAHARVDVAAAALDVERRPADRGQALHPGGVVALVRARDQPLAEPQRTHQLGAARQQRDDPRRRAAGDGHRCRSSSFCARRSSRSARRSRFRAPRSLSPGSRISMFTPPIIVSP